MRIFIGLVVVCLLLSGSLMAQTATITGTVRSETNRGEPEPLPGANVVLKGQNKGTSTDGNGRYSIATGPGQVLVISAIGYQNAEITVGNVGSSTQLDVTLKEAASQLNELVVVGYGTQDRKNLIGAVSQISADEIKTRPVASFEQQLQGRVAGVQLSANTGVPGDGLYFRIRGNTSINASNDPLYVVDGVFINNNSLQKITTQGQANNPLADINPADIESISILKDAEATAIYGARAANGVVVITT
ncbi:MAG: TonB-dependent receptor, partial [Cytophagaceae bacterium]